MKTKSQPIPSIHIAASFLAAIRWKNLSAACPILALTLLLSAYPRSNGKANNPLNRYLIEGAYMQGKMLDIYTGFPATSVHRGAFISVSRPSKRNGSGPRYGFPETGACLSFHDFGNDTVLGKGLALQYQIRFVQTLGRRLHLVEQVRLGGLITTRPYDYLSNPRNIVIGDPFSFLVQASAGLRYQFLPHHSIVMEAGVWHASNGHTGLPNVGMNSLMVSAAYQYLPFERRCSTHGPTPDAFVSGWHLAAFSAFGLNEAGTTIRPTNGGLYSKYLLGASLGRRFREIHRVTLSIEGYYDAAYRLHQQVREWPQETRPLALMVMVGHEFIFNHWGLLINGGINAYNPSLRMLSKSDPESTGNALKVLMPGRFAVRYYVRHTDEHQNSLYLQAGIKSNFGQADFTEFTIGYLWPLCAKRRTNADHNDP